MHKVLIITYYWPPSGGSAVLRWLKFTKYLREFGWEPVIYTPENPEPQEIDESLLRDIPENTEILKTRIIEPYSIYKWLTGKKQSDRLGVALMTDQTKRGLLNKISLWIRSNFFIPDPRILWVRPSIRNLARYLDKNPVDIIISTGPPHSMHLIAFGLKRKLKLKWLADFRDPWTNIDFYKELLLTTFADKYHKKLERKILDGADHIITVSKGISADFASMGLLNVSTITNGFDEEESNSVKSTIEKFSITHLGSLPKSRNPEILWTVLASLVEEDERFASQLEINLIGKVDQSIQRAIDQHGLHKYVCYQSYIPHDQTADILRSSAILLLCINNTPNAKGILTNKFFEYLSVKRPILALGPADGDAAFILAESGAGKIFGYEDSDLLKAHIRHLFDLYSQDHLTVNSSGIEKYSRRNLTGQLSEVLNNLLN
jgi:glycosyltransferase involved in cell wall biosynthesis